MMEKNQTEKELLGRIHPEEGVTGRGNWQRLKFLMRRADKGGTFRIGFIGGSITQGSLASDPALCYAFRVFEWWENAFPEADFQYINAGIGGTTSHFGAARSEEDLLAFEPDFVIVEFSVNDESSVHFLETYEGLVRRIYTSKTRPAVLLVHNVYYNNGFSAEVQHAKIGRHYELPCVSMQKAIFPALLSGKIQETEITPDGLHPNDVGHALVAAVITAFLEKVKAERERPEEEEKPVLPPLTPNTYERARRYRNDNSRPICRGFIPDQNPQEGITDCFKKGWQAKDKGDSITFTVRSSGIAVQYRRYVDSPVPAATAVVDGDEAHSVLLDAAFDETWGDKLELTTLAEHMPFGEHTVTITLTDTHKEDRAPFYLASVITAE